MADGEVRPVECTSCAASSCAAADPALPGSGAVWRPVRPVQGDAAALQATIANVKSILDTAVASASATLQHQVEQVKAAFAELQTAATGAGQRRRNGASCTANEVRL